MSSGGTYLIVQRMTLLGNVIAHAVLPGLAIAHFLNIDILWGAFVSGLLSSFATNWIRAQTRIKVDAAMALTLASFFALGVILITRLESRLDLDAFLFGDIRCTYTNNPASPAEMSKKTKGWVLRPKD